MVCTFQLDWHKNTLGKGIVQSGAEADCKRQWSTVLRSLQQLPDSSTSNNKLSGLGDVPSSLEAAAAGETQMMGPMLEKTGYGGLGLNVQTGILVVLLLVLAVLLLLLAGVWQVGGQLVKELHSLTAAIGSSSKACLP